MDFSFSDLNFNSVENLPGFEASAAFTVNSSSVFREDVDIADGCTIIPMSGELKKAARPSMGHAAHYRIAVVSS